MRGCRRRAVAQASVGTGQKWKIPDDFSLLNVKIFDKFSIQVAGLWIGLRKTFRVLPFFVLPPSASQLSRIGWRFNLFRFGPERTALGKHPMNRRAAD